MQSRQDHHSSKYRKRGFESLERRDALDGATLLLTQLPAAPLPNTAIFGVSVYAAPIGPAPASATPAIATGSATGTILAPISVAYLQQLNIGVLPIGPARPATLPSQQQTPAAAAQPLYAEGTLPTNQTPANLPTTRQTMPVIPEPPGVPSFTLVPGRPLY
jgi:hypothetical protein